ncbi:LysR family transcriptional regulator [Pseudoalteromonas luteoviolacea]|uniref:HTH lysR-type domain-containing protein n=1 Tax=Pseudoalteromonas luteoviolacea S4054 TaxID=1129367 RepID=A0A0F6AHV5_9GAMM|nr:LysR family transcriptional regulator [Pseudoalteromonas luteoviolacea]AOT07952.1 hypothetical protein S4054249_08895 [Pseudoalteromonas luteoviolacea]AOT12868.1 hypothetical protein S40542_08895 [Pseudoalteromonas luteoviolacea]AOT17781.1 hypothetical protein S4054_08890 [Pseudoalteromonas luteoviolacea]KKE85805.1 hypothetical protein N479_00095 [Pseudoalteromonas luteoviolacea S4054]KZN74683.1 hypothetical protein N481_08475 [Pseudoalteromonas luteoviolacea S4047-1]
MNEHKRIELLLLFVKLAEELNYTKAAKSLGISKGQLSDKIKRFEQVLNAPLLVRTTRSVKLTQYGQQVFEHGKSIRGQLFELERSVNTEKVDGMIRLTAPRMFAQIHLPRLCVEFKKHYPEVEFSINSSYTTHNLNNKDFDIAFRATMSPPQDMVAIKLFDYRHIIVASPSYINAHSAINQPCDLSEHACIVANGQSKWYFENETVLVNGWMSSNDNTLIKQYAIEGAGLIRVANYFVQAQLDNGQLIEVLKAYQSPQNGMYLFYPQSSQKAHKIRTFINFIKNYFTLNTN